jgi:hypothetical protein
MIRKVTPDGTVSTLAGSTQGIADGTGSAAQFNTPRNIRVSPSGDIYVCDTDNQRVRKITPAGVVTTLAGNGTQLSIDGTGTSASFGVPLGLTIDSTGVLFVTDGNSGASSGRLRRVTPEGVVTTMTDLDLYFPTGVAIDSTNTMVIVESSIHRIIKLIPTEFSGSSSSGCYALAWNDSIWVGGGTGINCIAYSSDGITWTGSPSGTALLTGKCNTVAWNGLVWVAGGSGANTFAYSPNGIQWTASASGNGTFTVSCLSVAWNGIQWVAGGGGTNRLCYSYNGITWQASSSGNQAITGECRTVSWNGVLWVAGGTGDHRLAYSSDGIAWTVSTSGDSVFTSTCNGLGRRVDHVVGRNGNPVLSVGIKMESTGTSVSLNSIRVSTSTGRLFIGLNTDTLTTPITLIGQSLYMYYNTTDSFPRTGRINLTNLSSPSVAVSTPPNYPTGGTIGDTIVAYVTDTTNNFMYKITSQQVSETRYAINIQQIL